MSTLYSVGQMNQLADALEKSGYSPEDVTALRSSPALLVKMRAELLGRNEDFVKALITITLRAVSKKLTMDCFTDKSRYEYRDSNLDLWFPKESAGREEGKATVWQLLKKLTLVEMAQHLLKTKERGIKKLSKLLKEAGHIFILPEIDALIMRQESGEDVGLLTNGYANFFFVEDVDGKVSVVYAYRCDGQWFVRAFQLDDLRGWGAEYRLLSRN